MEVVDWDKRYREGFYDGAVRPHTLLERFWGAVGGKTVIDIAMGNGRDALFLAGKGFTICGLERSIEAIRMARQGMEDKGLAMSIVMGDAEKLPFKGHSADAVLVFYFLLRDTMRDIRDMLKKGGIVIYETFLKRQNMIDRQRNPDYLLDDGELISYFPGFETLFYEEIISSRDGKRRAIARYVGRKR